MLSRRPAAGATREAPGGGTRLAFARLLEDAEINAVLRERTGRHAREAPRVWRSLTSIVSRRRPDNGGETELCHALRADARINDGHTDLASSFPAIPTVRNTKLN